MYAIVNSNDQWHKRAIERQGLIGRQNTLLVTTELVLIEIADGLSSVKFRAEAIRVSEMLEKSPFAEIIRLDSDLYRRGWNLYKSRTDKNWGLTDCVSFVAMMDRGIQDALTTDYHFQQAGFNSLLIDQQ